MIDANSSYGVTIATGTCRDESFPIINTRLFTDIFQSIWYYYTQVYATYHHHVPDQIHSQ